MSKSNRVLIGLGSNLPYEGLAGPRLLEEALRAIAQSGLNIVGVSGAWRSEAWPDRSQPSFVNAVAALDPGLFEPAEVYRKLAQVELGFGRQRHGQWAARTLDLDLLDQNGLKGNFGGIILPHPRMERRGFVLAPLYEIDPQWVHPESGRGIAALLAEALDEGLARIGPLRIAPSGLED